MTGVYLRNGSWPAICYKDCQSWKKKYDIGIEWKRKGCRGGLSFKGDNEVEITGKEGQCGDCSIE
jgi:hypothetical protein